jgi:hypothetical protein
MRAGHCQCKRGRLLSYFEDLLLVSADEPLPLCGFVGGCTTSFSRGEGGGYLGKSVSPLLRRVRLAEPPPFRRGVKVPRRAGKVSFHAPTSVRRSSLATAVVTRGEAIREQRSYRPLLTFARRRSWSAAAAFRSPYPASLQFTVRVSAVL